MDLDARQAAVADRELVSISHLDRNAAFPTLSGHFDKNEYPLIVDFEDALGLELYRPPPRPRIRPTDDPVEAADKRRIRVNGGEVKFHVGCDPIAVGDRRYPRALTGF